MLELYNSRLMYNSVEQNNLRQNLYKEDVEKRTKLKCKFETLPNIKTIFMLSLYCNLCSLFAAAAATDAPEQRYTFII